MQCPKCEGELRRVDLIGAQVDQCDQCCGVWFDFGELEQALAKEDLQKLRQVVNADSAQDAKRASCPRCGSAGKMIRLTVHDGLHIDCCSHCYGQWLDGGEVEMLKNKEIFQTVADFFKSIT